MLHADTLCRTKIEFIEVPLDDISHVLDKLRDEFAKAEYWEKVSTSRGEGYRYIAGDDLQEDDPLFVSAFALARHNPDLKNDVTVFFKVNDRLVPDYEYSQQAEKGSELTAPAIVITGEAKNILRDEFGVNLRDIPLADTQHGRPP